MERKKKKKMITVDITIRKVWVTMTTGNKRSVSFFVFIKIS